MSSLFDEPPVHTGLRGRAWRWFVPPAGSAGLGAWIVNAPGYHAVWHSYALSVVHLRDAPGVKPALKYHPEATHEIGCCALDPKGLIARGEPLPLLSPPNYAEQFKVDDDDRARAVLERTVMEIVDGRLSPDTDYWRDWKRRFPFQNPGRERMYSETRMQ